MKTFPVRNCSIVTSLVSVFFNTFRYTSFFLFVVIAPSLEDEPPLFSHRDAAVLLCVCVQLTNHSALFKPAPLGSNRKYSQDFLSLLHALKQDTSAEPAH